VRQIVRNSGGHLRILQRIQSISTANHRAVN
jgi:hypothetical protein